MSLSWHALVIDATDPGRLARWWAKVLRWRVIEESEGRATVAASGQPASAQVIRFQQRDARVAAQPAHRTRLRMELGPADRDAEVERLLDMGARNVDIGQVPGGHDAEWIILCDPEGNEFYVGHGG